MAHQFFLDHFPEKCRNGWTVLDLNASSGVFSVFAARLGASYVAPVDAHRRAGMFIGFNALLNGVQFDYFALHLGEDQSYKHNYELVIGNLQADQPHSLDSLTPIFEDLKDLIDEPENGSPLAQLMVVSPGDLSGPTALIQVGERMDGIVEIVVNAEPEPLEDYLHWLAQNRKKSPEELANIRAEAAAAGATHRHLCLFRYWKAQPPSFRVTSAKKVYRNWSMPLPGIELGWTSPTDPGRRSDD